MGAPLNQGCARHEGKAQGLPRRAGLDRALRLMKRWGVSFLLLVWSQASWAGEVTVAVASNFLTTAETIARDFEADTGHKVVISHGSTGQLFAQIDLGAPFDIFLAGDQERPEVLRAAGKTIKTRVYAFGRLSLVSTSPVTIEAASVQVRDKTVALADPTVAPYGKAATRAMERLSLDTATFRPVLVANVGQVASVFATGNADMAFVADAQVEQLGAAHVLSLDGLIPDIRQDAAFMARADGNEAATAFWEWLASEKGQALIAASGYGLPPE